MGRSQKLNLEDSTAKQNLPKLTKSRRVGDSGEVGSAVRAIYGEQASAMRSQQARSAGRREMIRISCPIMRSQSRTIDLSQPLHRICRQAQGKKTTEIRLLCPRKPRERSADQIVIFTSPPPKQSCRDPINDLRRCWCICGYVLYHRCEPIPAIWRSTQ